MIAGYTKTAPGRWEKFDPITRIGSRLIWENDGTIRVQKFQRVAEILDMNISQANNFSGYGKGGLTHVARVPALEWSKLMTKCGHVPGQGYDEKKRDQILNDSDFKYFKTIPGKI